MDIPARALLSGLAGTFFKNECLRPACNIMQCEVRLKEDTAPLREGTRCVLLLGADAAERWLNNSGNSLGEIRGSPYVLNGIVHIASYLPQDAWDFKDYESTHNELLAGCSADDESDGETGILADKSRHGKTSRSNWKFWLQQDTKKCLRIIANGGLIPSPSFEPIYDVYPDLGEVITKCRTYIGRDLFIDIETDKALNITVMSMSFSDDNRIIYIIPFLTHEYKRAYTALPQFLSALGAAMLTNTVVSHNGYSFDWLVLALKYKLPFARKYYDTMLAQHRTYPDVERSLGHCVSLWLYLPFHKDQSDFGYRSAEAAKRLWDYCGKDVYTMMLLKEALTLNARRIPGLTESITQVSESLAPYCRLTCRGIHYKPEALNAIATENVALMNQYLRIIRILIGAESSAILQKGSKSGFAGSGKQTVKYFHEMLRYKVVHRSKKTGAPSLAAQHMYKLKLAYANPVIDFVIKYRQLQTDTGSLGFIPLYAAPTTNHPNTHNA